MATKVAIYENDKALALLDNTKTLQDQVRLFLMLAFGIHPKNLREFDDTVITDGNELMFKRVKNGRARREGLTPHQAKVIKMVIKQGKLDISNQMYEQLCESYGDMAVPDYPTPPVSPMTLRHTFALNELRRLDFDYSLVAIKMGCTPTTLKQHYLDLEQWERLHQTRAREPLDLTHYEFMEDGNEA